MRITKSFGKKVHLGRLGVPIWSLALAGMALVAAAGQAVGPVLSGSVTGSAGLTVEQSVLLSDATAISFTGHSGDDYLGVTNDEGTSFTAAIEMHVGDTVVIRLPVVNLSDAPANAVLELGMPKGVDAEVEASAGATLKEAQMGRNAWLLWVEDGNSETLNITISPKDDLQPGFYTLSGRIVQING